MHIYNLCIGANPQPALILDLRSSEDFNACHMIGTYSCPIDSSSVTLADIERRLADTPLVLHPTPNNKTAFVH
jgi:hypothetical protein